MYVFYPTFIQITNYFTFYQKVRTGSLWLCSSWYVCKLKCQVDLCLLTVGQSVFTFSPFEKLQNVFNSRFRLNSNFCRKPYGMEFSSRRNVVPGNNVCWSHHLNKRAQLREERNGKRSLKTWTKLKLFISNLTKGNFKIATTFSRENWEANWKKQHWSGTGGV